MRRLSPEEETIWNQGERLIPGVTHDLAEVIRHKSSYLFFRKVLEWDFSTLRQEANPVQIVDLGCGVGYGCRILSTIPNSHVLGIDASPESLEYARCHYGGANIAYQVENLIQFIPAMPESDYVVSRGVFEHIQDGLRLALSAKCRHRLLFDVPYRESRGKNPHHVVFEFCEETFSGFHEMEFFFQDLEGVIYPRAHKPPNPNMMICVRSHPKLPKVSDSPISFPCSAWEPEMEVGPQGWAWSRIKWRLRKGLGKVVELRKNR